MVDERIYRVKIKKGELELEVQGDKDWVEIQIQNYIKESFFQFTKLEPKTIDVHDKELPVSLAEFLKLYTVASDTDRIMFFIYWLYYKEGLEFFNTSDIRNCFSEVRTPFPGNANQLLNNLQKSGYILRRKEKKEGKIAWIITPTGEQYVTDKLKK